MRPSKRFPVSKSKSVKSFRRQAGRTKAPNVAPYRGGFRF